MNLICRQCSKTYFYTRATRNGATKELCSGCYSTKRRSALKRRAVEYKGGSCSRCGYNRYMGALDFHHLDPSKKEIAIAQKIATRSWESIRQELDKCILLCANCHREIEAGILL